MRDQTTANKGKKILPSDSNNQLERKDDSPKQFSELLEFLSSLAAIREGASSTSSPCSSNEVKLDKTDSPSALQPNVVATRCEQVPVALHHATPAGK